MSKSLLAGTVTPSEKDNNNDEQLQVEVGLTPKPTIAEQRKEAHERITKALTQAAR